MAAFKRILNGREFYHFYYFILLLFFLLKKKKKILKCTFMTRTYCPMSVFFIIYAYDQNQRTVQWTLGLYILIIHLNFYQRCYRMRHTYIINDINWYNLKWVIYFRPHSFDSFHSFDTRLFVAIKLKQFNNCSWYN